MMSEQQQMGSENSTKPTQNNVEAMEIDLLEILKKIIRMRKTLYKTAGVSIILGLIVAFSIPKKYTVNVTLSPEMGNSKGNNGLAGLAASFLGNGVAMGESTDALNASLSSDIVSSTPFLLELLQTKVVMSYQKDSITFGSYLEEQSSPWWAYVMGIPRMIVDGLEFLFTEKEVAIDSISKGAIVLSEEENKKLEFLKKAIVASVDKNTAITNVSVTLQDPKIAATIADSAVYRLQKRIINYRTSKAKEDCIYLKKLFHDRKQEYYDAQKKYANYIDSHDNLILQSVRTEQDRLQNDMSLAYQIYSQVANQLEMARARVQEVKPVFAVVEPAVIPLRPSGMGKMIYIIAFLFLAIIGTIGWKLFVKDIFFKLREEVKTKS